MLVKLLSNQDQLHFFRLAKLLSVADKPLLWDGKTKEEVTSQTDMNNISFLKGETETKLLSDWGDTVKSEHRRTPMGILGAIMKGEYSIDVEIMLLDHLKNIPLHKNTEDSIERLNAVTGVLSRLLEGDSVTEPYAIRIVLYELMLMALASGGISRIEYRFLEIFKQHYQIEECDFDEIMKRAKTMYREVKSTIALILE